MTRTGLVATIGAAATLGALAACSDPPRLNDCVVTHASNALVNSGVQFHVAAPMRCKYTITAEGNQIVFLVGLKAPSTAYAGQSVVAYMHNSLGEELLPEGVEDVYVTGIPNAPCSTCSYAAPTLLFPAGTGGPPPEHTLSPLRTDFAELATWTPDEIGTAGLQLDGRIVSQANLIGPSGVFAPANPTWVATGADIDLEDTLSFQYQWFLNGSEISNATGRSLNSLPYGESGTYSVSTRLTLMDDSALSVGQNVTVYMGAEMFGPAGLVTGSSGSFSVTAYAARPPVTCVWTLNSQQIQSGSCNLNHTFGSAGTFGLAATATDARGIGAGAAMNVSVSDTDPCQPPECYEERPVPVTKRTTDTLPGSRSAIRLRPTLSLPRDSMIRLKRPR